MTLDELLRLGLRSAIISVAALAIAGFFFWTIKRHRTATGVSKPRKVQSFLVNMSPEELARRVRGAIQGTPYRIEEGVRTDAAFLLSEEATATSWGFYYPIYLTPMEKYQTRVEIGVESKSFQIGPVVKKHHRKCVEKMKSILGVGVISHRR